MHSAAQTSETPTSQLREQMLSGMACVDTSGNTRIPVLMEMVGALSRADKPQTVLREFAKGLNKLQRNDGFVSISTRDLAPGEYRITRLLTDGGPDRIDATDPWHNRQDIPIHRGGFIGEIIRQAYPELIHHLKVTNDPVIGDALAPFGSLIAVPLFDNGEPLNWSISLRREPEGFTVENLEDAILRNNLVGSTVRNVLAAEEIAKAHDTIRREVHRIADIQRALLPETMPEIKDLSIAASYETFDSAGGDYYDFLPLGRRSDGSPDPDAPWCLLIADASGHGPAAAVVMAMLHAILHAYPYIAESPGHVLQHANDQLCSKRIEGTFVTAFMAIYHPTTRALTYARAGHNPPLIKNCGSGGSVRRLEDVGGVPLGVMPNVEYQDATTTIQAGQSLVLYTDGITEAMNPNGRMFGIEGIEQSLVTCTGEPQCVVGSIGTALREHEAGVRPSDDQTLVVARVE